MFLCFPDSNLDLKAKLVDGLLWKCGYLQSSVPEVNFISKPDVRRSEPWENEEVICSTRETIDSEHKKLLIDFVPGIGSTSQESVTFITERKSWGHHMVRHSGLFYQ